jgi:hypothetical protein
MHQSMVLSLACGADALLPRHECKAHAQLKQKRLQLVHQALFQIGFQQASGARQAQELQQHRVADKFARCLIPGRQQGAGIHRHGGLVPAGEQALVVQRADLPLQRAGTPVLPDRFAQIARIKTPAKLLRPALGQLRGAYRAAIASPQGQATAADPADLVDAGWT